MIPVKGKAWSFQQPHSMGVPCGRTHADFCFPKSIDSRISMHLFQCYTPALLLKFPILISLRTLDVSHLLPAQLPPSEPMHEACFLCRHWSWLLWFSFSQKNNLLWRLRHSTGLGHLLELFTKTRNDSIHRSLQRYTQCTANSLHAKGFWPHPSLLNQHRRTRVNKD